MTTHSLVIPVYKNAANVSALVDALVAMNARLQGDLEIIFVVDGSPDDSGELILNSLAGLGLDTTVVFHSRNFGSFTAIRTGMEHARGRYIAAMAADLQEPPELIDSFFAILAADKADVVFGTRRARQDPMLTKLLSGMFWSAFRKFVIPAMPKGGVDIFGCNRSVLDAVLSIEEPNSSLVAQLFWVGFRREFVPYDRRARTAGRSAWNFARRIRYMMDSILAFTDLPILWVFWIGVGGCLLSVVLAVATLVARLAGYIEEAGYTSLILTIVFFGSLTLAVQGMLGSYIWRTAENTKRRPLRIVSRVVTSRTRDV